MAQKAPPWNAMPDDCDFSSGAEPPGGRERVLPTLKLEVISRAGTVTTPITARTSSDDNRSRVQRHTVRVLFTTQIIGGVGVTIGLSVGALLAAKMGGAGVSGLAASAVVVGAALIAVPATRIMRAGGRRPGLVFAYLIGLLGAVVVVAGAAIDRLALVFLGTFLFGGATAANLQARYTAVDLAEPRERGRQLSLIVWATTVGAVAGPIAAPFADRAVSGLQLPEYAGPFAMSAAAFALAALLLQIWLRPDPLLVARRRAPALDAADQPTASGIVVDQAPAAGATSATGDGLPAAWRAVMSSPRARLGMAAVAVGHVVMVGVMSMTPVHIGHSAIDRDAVLRIVGIVLSLHIAGMYAFSPVTGWLTDRMGRRPVILLSAGALIAACAVSALAGDRTAQLAAGLFLLGLGWSGTMVAGSTLLSESVDVSVRPAAQGLNDLVMGLGGASAAALSGPVVQLWGYPTLPLISALATVPLLFLALRPIPRDREASERI
jgi:MFS family permease